MRLLKPKSPDLDHIRLYVTGETAATEKDQRLKTKLRSNYTSVSHDRILVVKGLQVVDGTDWVTFEADPNLFGSNFEPDVLYDNRALDGIMAEKAIIAQLLNDPDQALEEFNTYRP